MNHVPWVRMRGGSLPLLLLLWTASAVFAPSRASEQPAVPIGAKVEAAFTDLYWQKRHLADFGPRSAFVVYFATIECPIVGRSLPGLDEVAAEYRGKDVVVLVLNVGAGDAFVDAAGQVTMHAPLARFGKDFDLAFARACGVERTNTVVLLDAEHRLRYRGRIDDRHTYASSRERALHSDLRIALDELLAGRVVSVPETEASGCQLTPRVAPTSPKVPTYGQEVGPLFERTCLRCHLRDPAGGVSLGSEADRSMHAAMIREVIEQGRMPPWPAARLPGSGDEFSNRLNLTLAERETVVVWLANGMPRGEWNGRLPHVMDLPWRIGDVAVAIPAPAAIQVPASGVMQYEYLVLPHEFPVETWVQAIDVRSEHASALHHCNLAIVPSDAGFSTERIVANFTPHGAPLALPPGFALRIPAGSRIALQAYYVPTGTAFADRLQVGLRFPAQPVQQELRLLSFGNPAFEVPARAAAHRVEAVGTISEDADAVSVFVHMHARGRDVIVLAQPPVGVAERLLTLPAFDFGAQQTYQWARDRRAFPKGTVVRAIAHFDNSEWNPRNPAPEQLVRCGPTLADEQLQVVLAWRKRGEQLAIPVDARTGRRIAESSSVDASK